MTRIEKLQELLEFYIKQGHSYDMQDYRKGWSSFQKYGTEFVDLNAELQKRLLIERVDKGNGHGYVFEISTDGERFYKDGGFIGEEKRKTNELELQSSSAILQAELFPILIEANKSVIITNENTRKTNKVLIIIFAITALLTLINIVVTIVIACIYSKKS